MTQSKCCYCTLASFTLFVTKQCFVGLDKILLQLFLIKFVFILNFLVLVMMNQLLVDKLVHYVFYLKTVKVIQPYDMIACV